MNGSYDIYNECSSVEQELERLEAQTLLSWRKEAELMSLYGVKSGKHLLEIGSGPGYVSKRILCQWENIQLTVLEKDPGLIFKAKENIKPLSKNVQFLEASVFNIPLGNNEADFVFARFVLQHINDLDSALSEIYRVLKPGGKLIISEIDPELWGRVYPYETGLEHIYQKHAGEQQRHGGDRFVVRKLPVKMKECKFQKIRTDVFSYDSIESDLSLFVPQISPERYEPLLRKGIINEIDYALIQAAYNRFIVNREAYVMLLGVLMCGEKL